MRKFSLFSLVLLGAAAVIASVNISVEAQRRDFLTDDEIEIVRDTQQIDQRVAVLVHAADRRFTALGIANAETGDNDKDVKKDKKEKDSDKWGAVPTGTRFELLDDVRRILQKAADDIDNLATRPDSIVVEGPAKNQKPKTYKEVFPKAVHILASAAKRFKPILEKQTDLAKDEREKGVILQSIELCGEIINAESQLQPTTPVKSSN